MSGQGILSPLCIDGEQVNEKNENVDAVKVKTNVDIGFDVIINEQIGFVHFIFISNLLKIIEAIFSVVCISVILSDQESFCKWLLINYCSGFFISGFFFVFYMCNIINKSHKHTLIIDSFYCVIWGGILVICAGFGTINFNPIKAILLLAYTIDLYMNCTQYMNKNVLILQIIPTNPTTDPQPIVNTPYRKFFKSQASKLKVLIMIIQVIYFTIIEISDKNNCIIQVITVTAFCITALLLVFHILDLIARAPKTWLIECILSISWSILLIPPTLSTFAFCLSTNEILTCLIPFLLCIGTSVLYGIDGSQKLHGYLSKRTPIGDIQDETEEERQKLEEWD